MLLKDLIDVVGFDRVTLIMTNKFTSQTITINKDVFDNTKVFHIGVPYISILKVKDIYADCGVVAELKFNKQFFNSYKKVFDMHYQRGE